MQQSKNKSEHVSIKGVKSKPCQPTGLLTDSASATSEESQLTKINDKVSKARTKLHAMAENKAFHGADEHTRSVEEQAQGHKVCYKFKIPNFLIVRQLWNVRSGTSSSLSLTAYFVFLSMKHFTLKAL